MKSENSSFWVDALSALQWHYDLTVPELADRLELPLKSLYAWRKGRVPHPQYRWIILHALVKATYECRNHS